MTLEFAAFWILCTPSSKKRANQSPSHIPGLSAFLGLLFIVGGVLVFLHFRDLINGIIRSVWQEGPILFLLDNNCISLFEQRVPLAEDSPVTKSWLSPPVTPLIRLYFFNYTNPEGFLRGEKPRVQELGPYVYR